MQSLVFDHLSGRGDVMCGFFLIGRLLVAATTVLEIESSLLPFHRNISKTFLGNNVNSQLIKISLGG